MKRFYLALAIFILLIATSGYSLVKIGGAREELTQRTTALNQLAEQEENDEALQAACQQLVDYWQGEEQVLIRYIRHGELDSITNSVSRLPALCDQEDRAELKAELSAIHTIIDHIWKSELPLPRNIL